MPVALDADDRFALEAAAVGERRARVWRRCRAVLLLGDGEPAPAVARALGCSASSVYGWAAAWRAAGFAGLAGRGHGGGTAPLAERAGPLLEGLLAQDPQALGHAATGWTVPLLRGELAAAGVPAGERTIRRALHRLGWSWKRPKFALGRPDPGYEAKRGA